MKATVALLMKDKMRMNGALRKINAEDLADDTTKLFCGKCESMMVGESGTGKSGAKHYYYKCASAKRKRGCDKKAIKKDYIENLVVKETTEERGKCPWMRTGLLLFPRL